MLWSLAEIQGILAAMGDLDDVAERRPGRVVTDCCLVEPGDLFVCLTGEHFDGHAFARDAAAKGALAVVAERPVPDLADLADLGVPVLMTTLGTVEALGRLAAQHRARTMARVLGIAGAAGTSMVRDLLAGILSRVGRVHRNYPGQSDVTGLPLSMLAAQGDEDFWVFKVGGGDQGAMDRLSAMLRPDLALIVNQGPAFGESPDKNGGETSLLFSVRTGGHRVLCFDYPELRLAAGETAVGFTTAQTEGARYSGRYVGPAGPGSDPMLGETEGRFRLSLAGETVDVALPWQGRFALENALAAATAAHVLGVSVDAITQGLEDARPARQHFQCRRTGDLLLIDDSCGANPLSMAVSLDSARQVAQDRPLVALLGEMHGPGMGEDAARRAHEELGRQAAKAGLAGLFWVGGFGDEVGQGLSRSGFSGRFQRVETVTGFVLAWREMQFSEPVLLVKGSRTTKLETYVGALLKECA